MIYLSVLAWLVIAGFVHPSGVAFWHAMAFAAVFALLAIAVELHAVARRRR